jgi:hypothetical protein
LELAVAVLDNKDPIRRACDDDKWDDIAASSVNGERFYQLAFGQGSKAFWRRLELVVDLLKPVAAAIHQLEADQPMLSQVLPVWRALTRHFVEWHSKVADAHLKADNAPAVLRERKQKSMSPAAYAAFALDPLNFPREDSAVRSSSRGEGDSSSSSKWRSSIQTMAGSEQQMAKDLLKRMAGAGTGNSIDTEWSGLKLTLLTGALAEDLSFIQKKVGRLGGQPDPNQFVHHSRPLLRPPAVACLLRAF